jgi:hypothetical protein
MDTTAHIVAGTREQRAELAAHQPGAQNTDAHDATLLLQSIGQNSPRAGPVPA